jgi:thiosulfate/3-mercaptopyruvate sulfurtransferase
VFQLFGHTNAKVMDGGRLKWEKEGREMTRDVPKYPATHYQAPERDDHKVRAFRDEVLEQVKAGKPLVDVRSVPEYTGERLHMADYPNEGALRGGHIPGAKNVPWGRAANPEDGTFKSADELRAIYEQEQGLKPTDDIIAYCRIGERSSHTWFVLKNLLGYPNVRNYDGSWTEWGNSVGVPIEK